MDFCGRAVDDEPIYAIDAVIEYDYIVSERVALRIEHRQNDGYSDEQINEYNEFIANVYNVVVSYGFDILKEFQSSESVSYYVDFRPKGVDGNPLDVIRIRFRISDHPLKKGKGGDNFGVDAIFKSFWFGGEKYENMVALVFGVQKACDAIRVGDWSALQKL